jgi:predicted transglutaminase-like cysteine proteinase
VFKFFRNPHDIRKFLKECQYVYDIEQFEKKDYWLPPEEFEKTKKGDCEDFSLWTWRQLMNLGYKCRFVGGRW